jgi:hypothetical protein
MKEMEVVNGGEISGSRVAASIRWVQAGRKCARDTVKANRKPSAVPRRPTSKPSRRLLRKALRWLGLARMARRGEIVRRPSSRKAAESIISNG